MFPTHLSPGIEENNNTQCRGSFDFVCYHSFFPWEHTSLSEAAADLSSGSEFVQGFLWWILPLPMSSHPWLLLLSCFELLYSIATAIFCPCIPGWYIWPPNRSPAQESFSFVHALLIPSYIILFAASEGGQQDSVGTLNC